MPLPISVTVITLNEERNLARCLDSVQGIADETIVVDSGSTDATRAIAERFNARFIENPWPGNVAQNALAFSKCTQPWVLSIDADEQLTEELRKSILSRLPLCDQNVSGFNINRRTQYLGKWMWNIWYPEWRLRLVRRKQARWVGPDPHGRMEVAGKTENLQGDLLHYTYKDLDDQYQKLISYARSSAIAGFDQGRRMHPVKLLFSPWFRFLRDVLLKSGWRDGWRGIMIAYAGAFSSFLKQAYLYEIEQRERDEQRKRESGDP